MVLDVPFDVDVMPSFGLFPDLDLRKWPPIVDSTLDSTAPKQNQKTARIRVPYRTVRDIQMAWTTKLRIRSGDLLKSEFTAYRRHETPNLVTF